MLPEKVKDRAAIILSGMMASDAPDKQTKVRAAVEYAIMLEKRVEDMAKVIDRVAQEETERSTR